MIRAACSWVGVVMISAGLLPAMARAQYGYHGGTVVGSGQVVGSGDYVHYDQYAQGSMNQGYLGGASIGSGEPLFQYDDQEPWKHGYLQIMPYYGGHQYFRPYNYKHVFGQSQTAVGWGMPSTMPYSQQFWHRYQYQVDLSQGGGVGTMPTPAPVPMEIPDAGPWTPIHPTPRYLPSTPGYAPQPNPGQMPQQPAPIYTPIGYPGQPIYGVPSMGGAFGASGQHTSATGPVLQQPHFGR